MRKTIYLVLCSIAVTGVITGTIALAKSPDDSHHLRYLLMAIATGANFALAVKYLTQYLTPKTNKP